ncbi:Delta-12 fatty acid desaturase protein [Mycena venus]|uniref:Delta-12 fatty acid desaturase protein n=1 Tax=Mycena venus TaxID=2733690 RepID=A0A8H7CZR0_9AGAR|nr:Delta-12 fatty acid desaturase protein [Mycena venus]
MFVDGAEYLKRRDSPFSPPDVTYKELRAVIPPELYDKSTLKGLFYFVQDVATVCALYALCLRIDAVSENLTLKLELSYPISMAFYSSLWVAYWVSQSIAMAGCWCLGHEAGHGNISKYAAINDVLGYFLHTCLLTPYFAWKSSHHTHHKTVGSVERDENYVPRTRSELGLTTEQLHEMFEETPLYTLGRMLVMQLLGFQTYLLFNTLGCPRDPPGTNHFFPSSVLFKKKEYNKIVASNVGLILFLSVLIQYSLKYGPSALMKHYIVAYLVCHHWIVMLTFLHHSDPTIPHYRAGQWTPLRGALATAVPGHLLLYRSLKCPEVSHDHIGHHLFTSIPFYNQPAVTEKIKSVLADHYNHDSTAGLLYDGEIVFYMNKNGLAARVLAVDARDAPSLHCRSTTGPADQTPKI